MFISNAFAQTTAAAGQSQGGGDFFMTMLPFIVLMFVVMYFASIRPQMKEQKEKQALQSALKKGDEVVTISGIVGRVVKVGESGYVTLEIAKDVEILVQKNAIANILLTGTIKTL